MSARRGHRVPALLMGRERPSSSRTDRGIGRLKYQAINQRDEAVLEFVLIHLLWRRPK